MIKRVMFFTLFILIQAVNAEILVTVPHAHCLPIKERNCDRLAEVAAKKLATKLGTKLLFISGNYREDTDLNREEGRITSFRTEIAEALKKCRQFRRNCVLIDVHSFPADSFPGKIEKAGAVPDVYFIRAYYGNELATFLHKHLTTNRIAAQIFEGTYQNDILLEATYNHIPSVIIEFNESLGAKKLSHITSVLAQAIKNYESGVTPSIPSHVPKVLIILIIIAGIAAFFLMLHPFRRP